MGFLLWLESAWLSVWIRESPSLLAFPFILFLHTLGLGLLVGISVVTNLWALGLVPAARLASMQQLFPFAWLGFWINTASGLLLLIAYPTKALTNPVFYAKLAMVGCAVAGLQRLRDAVVAPTGSSDAALAGPRMRIVAWLTLALWAGAITTGRLLAYTYNYLTAAELAF